MDAYAKSVINMVLEAKRNKQHKVKHFNKHELRGIRERRHNLYSDNYNIKKGRNRRREINEINRELGKYYIKFDGLFREYLDDIDKHSKIKMSKEQRDLIQNAVENGRYNKLPVKESRTNRSRFNGKKSKIIEQWENHYHTDWPRYKEQVVTRKGKVARLKGGRYDMHHVIHCSYGGDAEWWNVVALYHPDMHQQGVHRKGSPDEKIFGRG